MVGEKGPDNSALVSTSLPLLLSLPGCLWWGEGIQLRDEDVLESTYDFYTRCLTILVSLRVRSRSDTLIYSVDAAKWLWSVPFVHLYLHHQRQCEKTLVEFWQRCSILHCVAKHWCHHLLMYVKHSVTSLFIFLFSPIQRSRLRRHVPGDSWGGDFLY